MCIRDSINEKLGDKYRVEVYPSELLGSQTEMVQLTQTGAIDFVVASTAIMELSLIHIWDKVRQAHKTLDLIATFA